MSAFDKLRQAAHWLPGYAVQRLSRRAPRGAIHAMIALADHFEPSIQPGTHEGRAERRVQQQRLDRWCREYPKLVEPWRDADGCCFRHTYFYPAEQYDPTLIDELVQHCLEGWGEIEVHLHHGVERPGTAAGTRQVITDFRDELARRGCLSFSDRGGPPGYAFVHGNFTLANSGRNGECCGVDDEMEVLAATGCYADLTLPSAPNPSQVRKINAVYECALPLNVRAPHRRGRDLESGRAPEIFPLIVQGPLMLNFARRKRGLPYPAIENGELATRNPPTLERFRLWTRAGISVRGRPDWIFVKLHCHGMDPRDDEAMLGELMCYFLRDLTAEAKASGAYRLHFVTAREMVNIILAACDGRDGNPGEYRDYRLQLNASVDAQGRRESALLSDSASRHLGSD